VHPYRKLPDSGDVASRSEIPEPGGTMKCGEAIEKRSR